LEQPLSQFFASQMITQEWVQPGNGEHTIFPAASDIADATARSLVTAYVVKRPDGQYSVMLVNKDQFTPHTVGIRFNDRADKTTRGFHGAVTVSTFGKAQYQWHPTATGGKAEPDGPILHSTLRADDGTAYTLPAASVTVIRGALGGQH
jgi:hypothetical protein